jgi:Cyanophycin synthase-like N-terminal domain
VTLPDPHSEIRTILLRNVVGANYWSRKPVTRMDLAIGAYEDISSADVPGFRESLQRAMPGLIEHRCSIGERGGFLMRLDEGTYAGHIIEHVALELQNMAGDDLGYGKTRGGNAYAEYTLVFEYRHPAVGLLAATLAHDIVCRAFASTLDGLGSAIEELRAVAATPVLPVAERHVMVGITGGSARAETRLELDRHGISAEKVVEVTPALLFEEGLPFAMCDVAIITDATLTDVPERYREAENARKLVSVVCDGASGGGIVVAPAREHEIQEYARRQGCRLALFSLDERVALPDDHAFATACITENRIRIQIADGAPFDEDLVREDIPHAAQVAAALAARVLGPSHGA